MTSSSASDHGNPAGIAALMQMGTTSKGMEANKNFAKWLSCGIQISGTFGLHHVDDSQAMQVIKYLAVYQIQFAWRSKQTFKNAVTKVQSSMR
jgi:hypothetical protein